MRRTKSLILIAVFALAAVVDPQPLSARRQAALSPDLAVMRQLLDAPPGTYTVNGGVLGPADRSAAIPVFVQADALGPAEGGGIRVPLAVGVSASAPWVMQIQLYATGSGASGAPSTSLSFAGQAGVVRDSGETTLAPGEYDLVVAVAQRRGGREWIGTTWRQPLSVPDLSGGLAASPVVLGEKAAASSPADTGRPFVFGPTAITPAPLNRFRQTDRIHVGFRIRGWKADAQSRPDVTVEYVFEQQIRDRLRFFNKTKPQELNASTLGATFDGQGGVLATGMTIPLAAFPPGEFQLVVRVKDRRTQATTVQKTRFVVQP